MISRLNYLLYEIHFVILHLLALLYKIRKHTYPYYFLLWFTISTFFKATHTYHKYTHLNIELGNINRRNCWRHQ